MNRLLLLAAAALLVSGASLQAAGVTGQYIEARTCDVWTGPCFANAEMNLSGKHAVLGWKVDKGEFDNVSLDGLGVVAVVAASDTLGLPQTGQSKTVLIVDSRATAEQKVALIKLAKKQGGQLTANVVGVESAKIDLDICPCEGNACATLKAGGAKIETRCLDEKHDKVCGNESAFDPPLAKAGRERAAYAVQH